MDVSSFLGGNYLTQMDLPAQPVVWRITDVKQQLVGTDTKICVYFAEHQKPLGLNKGNLRTIATGYGLQAEGWINRPLELYRDQTHFQGRMVPCVRVRIPQQPQYSPAPQPQTTAYQPAMQQPQPVAPAPAIPQPQYVQPQQQVQQAQYSPASQQQYQPQQAVQPAAVPQQLAGPAPWEQAEGGDKF